MLSFLSRLRGNIQSDPKPIAHPQTYLTLNQLGNTCHPFQPTYSYRGKYINDHHRIFPECRSNGALIDIGIPGWLLSVDALKLYELTYFAQGDVVGIGCYHGLNVYIMAMAIRDSGSKKRLLCIDRHPANLTITTALLEAHKYDAFSELRCGDGADVCRQLAEKGRCYDFVFVDDSHTYKDVAALCSALSSVMNPGGMCLFHDYNNKWNVDPDNHDYKVWQAVDENLSKDIFDFYGTYGCTGLFRRTLSPTK